MRNFILILLVFSPLYLLAQLGSDPYEAILLSNWQDTTLPATSVSYANIYNDVWGFEKDGREYGIIGSSLGVHFIDVTDPFNLIELQSAFVGGSSQNSNNVHRDYHTHKGYLYTVADEGLSTLQIIDLSYLPDSTVVVYDSDNFLKQAHNIFIDEENDRLYTAGSAVIGGFHNVGVYDISNPEVPVLLSFFTNGSLPPIPYVHDLFVKDNIGYLNCTGQGLYIVDFTDPTNAIILGTMSTYTQQGFNHSGWLNIDNLDYYYMADENHGKDLKVVNVADFSDITVDTTFNEESGRVNSIPHNLIYHCNKLYVSYYYDGLQVFDLSDPARPVREFYYDTYPGPDQNSFRGAWGVYPFLPSGNVLISDMHTGLYVFGNTVDPSCPTSVAVYDQSNETSAEVSVSPMPFNNSFSLELTIKKQETAQIELFDLRGQQVMDFGVFNLSQGLNKIQLETNLPSGVYLLHLNGLNFHSTHKMIKF